MKEHNDLSHEEIILIVWCLVQQESIKYMKVWLVCSLIKKMATTVSYNYRSTRGELSRDLDDWDSDLSNSD